MTPNEVIPQGLSLSKGTTRSITERYTIFLGKIIDVSLSATKKAASKCMVCCLSDLHTATDLLPIISYGFTETI